VSSGTIYRIPQDTETPTRTRHSAHLKWRHTYARAEECRAAGEPGQDYLAFEDDPQTFVFALCDGVSQSFFGDLAARLLGNRLLDWLRRSLPETMDPGTIEGALADCLSGLTVAATEQIRAYALPPDLPELIADVLREKQAQGSESTFVCGRIDQPGRAFPTGRVTLAWMGDSRLRVWGASAERTAELGDTFHTNERWSSTAGAVRGRPHAFVSPVRTPAGAPLVTRLMAYSDGLAALDRTTHSVSDPELDSIVESTRSEPGSDDISFLECALWPEESPLPGDIRPTPATGIALVFRRYHPLTLLGLLILVADLIWITSLLLKVPA
jgi:hypothetical protein